MIYYRYRLDQSKTLVLDPAFRFQPEGPLGPSKIVDPARFLWHDIDWKGVKIAGQVIYAMHIGTFTAELHGVPQPISSAPNVFLQTMANRFSKIRTPATEVVVNVNGRNACRFGATFERCE